MTLDATLRRHARAGSLSRTVMLNCAVFTTTTHLGTHRGQDYSVSITVISYVNGGHRTTTEVWSGDQQVDRAPLEANWPAVKALRELHAGDQGEDVVTRLLEAAL